MVRLMTRRALSVRQAETLWTLGEALGSRKAFHAPRDAQPALAQRVYVDVAEALQDGRVAG